MKIILNNKMESCITDGCRTIPAGTIMEKFTTCCNWTYFKGAGFTLIIMNFEDWANVSII